MKLLKITRHRLHAAEDDLALALLTLQTGGENIRFQPKRTVFTVILRHQFFNVGQNQYASARQPRQFGDHQAFAGAGRQYDGGGLMVTAEPGERGVNGLFW